VNIPITQHYGYRSSHPVAIITAICIASSSSGGLLDRFIVVLYALFLFISADKKS